jgi:hypothetical protein
LSPRYLTEHGARRADRVLLPQPLIFLPPSVNLTRPVGVSELPAGGCTVAVYVVRLPSDTWAFAATVMVVAALPTMSVVGELVDPVTKVLRAAEYTALTFVVEARNDVWQTAVGAAAPSVNLVHPGTAPPLALNVTVPAGWIEPAGDETVAISVTVWPATGVWELVCRDVVLGAVMVSVRGDTTVPLVPPELLAVSANAIVLPTSGPLGVYVTSVAPGIGAHPDALHRSH